MKQISEHLLKKVIISRSPNTHKWNYGRLLLIGGTYPYGGAIMMAALAAVYSGAGLVTVATNRDNLTALHSHLPEAMGFDLADHELLCEQLQKASVILVGPGLKEARESQAILHMIFEQVSSQQVLILDGGAISLFAASQFELPKAQLVFTPHQKEWEKLSGLELVSQTEDKSRRAVQNFPKGTVIVEKGPHTRIWTSGQEEGYQLDVGGPYQATGGMGDTLAGMIAGFAGQFPQVSLYERVVTATYLHSAIAEKLSQENYVVLPTLISKEIPKYMKNITDATQEKFFIEYLNLGK
ncbi:NAD(P)HX dehydratase [Streptococcus sp. DD10]|uniref:NAD(P)H-hydrate dehydratase n=1 Tax=Streptococcus sp. DD10 TaxID=1777878 RepID=UPI000791E34A|nr:NAD(P)H-hydrate dehydratase [Streptococcus sp. DD10]KXT74119.1 NAD(P)HX dehydratase [Streptococcus sp. DD10]